MRATMQETLMDAMSEFRAWSRELREEAIEKRAQELVALLYLTLSEARVRARRETDSRDPLPKK